MIDVQKRTVTVLSATQVIGSLGVGAGLTIGALLVKDITGSTGWAGLATVVQVIGAATVTVPLAKLAARAGRRPALVTGWCLGCVGAFVCIRAAVADSLPLVLLGLALFGVSTATSLQSRFAAADRAAPESVGRSLSLVVWAGTIGAVIGPNLVEPGARVAHRLRIPPLAGPMVFSLVGFAIAAVMTFALLRPDPLAETLGGTVERPSMRSAIPYVRGPIALAIYAIATAHAIMVAVMALTPVHMQDHGAALRIIGITISLHIAGMFALSPVMGWIADRLGPMPTILAGQLILIAAVAFAGTSGHSETRIMLGLGLLGVGWSASVIAGAALVAKSTDGAIRPLVQGLTDLSMHLAGAAGGLLAGIIVAAFGYGILNAAAGVLTIPLIVAVLAARQKAAVSAPA
ncbi:MAG TPA: MFS transporter [Aeromicrobium sp.]|nr:MFS transporter [Aeromicrobium sp.]